MTSETLLSQILNWFQNHDQPEINETAIGSEIELGFVGENGEKISFEDIAKGLPGHYAVTDENGFPPLEERVVISKNIKFYDLFQIVEVSENDTERLKFTTGAGWYWATYYGEPISGFGHVGPFAEIPTRAEIPMGSLTVALREERISVISTVRTMAICAPSSAEVMG